jgi:hypothetical protein
MAMRDGAALICFESGARRAELNCALRRGGSFSVVQKIVKMLRQAARDLSPT